jgi:hypothetical protein
MRYHPVKRWFAPEEGRKVYCKILLNTNSKKFQRRTLPGDPAEAAEAEVKEDRL